MAVTLRGARAILLPGTGSDDDYLRRAFGPALTQAGVVFTAHRPCPDRLVAGYLDALDEAAERLARPDLAPTPAAALGNASTPEEVRLNQQVARLCQRFPLLLVQQRQEFAHRVAHGFSLHRLLLQRAGDPAVPLRHLRALTQSV